MDENNKFDVVFVDPPRKGLGEKFINALIKSAPKKIIYISCDPATMSRDLLQLSDTYNIKSIKPFNMFPKTCDVECVCIMKLKK